MSDYECFVSTILVKVLKLKARTIFNLKACILEVVRDISSLGDASFSRPHDGVMHSRQVSVLTLSCPMCVGLVATLIPN